MLRYKIGSGRLQLDSDSVQDNHDNNYVSWWPAGEQNRSQTH